MSGTFAQRITELQDRVGHGRLVGTVKVDQVYARYQHEGLDLHHPHGGQAEYLRQPTIGDAQANVQTVADSTLHGGPADGMTRVVDRIAGQVAILAPVDENDLRRSAATRVQSGARTVHERPAAVPRLTEEQLRAKSRRRSSGR